MILVAASFQDPAGKNIAQNLIDHFNFDKINNKTYENKEKNAMLVILKERTIYADFLEKRYRGIDAIFFVSKHASKKDIPTLTTHTPGNFNQALYGGKEKELCISNPSAQKIALQVMQEEKEKEDLDFGVSLEATHHGPLTDVATTFFEIGSSLDRWNNSQAGYIVAKAVFKALDYRNYAFKKAVGVGGGHYSKKLTTIALDTCWAIGHIIPKYAFPLEEKMAQDAIKKNGGCDAVIFDWKGTPQRTIYQKIFESLNIDTFKTALGQNS
ncbi:MAG: D-aminoacyl-tRNA deacylase [Candidatus Methanofastidiosia archaeon]